MLKQQSISKCCFLGILMAARRGVGGEDRKERLCSSSNLMSSVCYEILLAALRAGSNKAKATVA